MSKQSVVLTVYSLGGPVRVPARAAHVRPQLKQSDRPKHRLPYQRRRPRLASARPGHTALSLVYGERPRQVAVGVDLREQLLCLLLDGLDRARNPAQRRPLLVDDRGQSLASLAGSPPCLPAHRLAMMGGLTGTAARAAATCPRAPHLGCRRRLSDSAERCTDLDIVVRESRPTPLPADAPSDPPNSWIVPPTSRIRHRSAALMP